MMREHALRHAGSGKLGWGALRRSRRVARRRGRLPGVGLSATMRKLRDPRDVCGVRVGVGVGPSLSSGLGRAEVSWVIQGRQGGGPWAHARGVCALYGP